MNVNSEYVLKTFEKLTGYNIAKYIKNNPAFKFINIYTRNNSLQTIIVKPSTHKHIQHIKRQC